MESKRLAPISSKPVKLRAGEHAIEVGPGDHAYQFVQKRDQKSSYTFHLRHEGSRISISGLVDCDNKSTPELETLVIHHVPHTEAETIVKTLSQGEAAPRYKGMIHIEPGARDSVSYLNHHALLIGEKAKNWTVPSLEILNNEVRCSHAATTRTLTPEDLFYLQSRGLSAAEAQQLLIDTFLVHA